MVILLGAELFTGDCLMALGVAEKHISVADCIRVLVLVFLGNFAGALIFTALVYCSGQLDYSAGGLGAYTIKVAYGKATLPFGKAFTSGILCNILVCAADGNLRKRYQRKAACIFLCNHAVCNSRL